MGLSASQARLLTITARKSDCEFQSMSLSHQKIALSRDMENITSAYQNALNKTKLVYDFYGTGSSDLALNYNLLMTPSIYNDYFPKLVTDATNRVVLNPALAAAARAAGIPAEGLGGTGSSYMRDAFFKALGAQGVITAQQLKSIQNTEFDNTIGVGRNLVSAVNTESITYDELVELLDTYGQTTGDYGLYLGGFYALYSNGEEDWRLLSARDHDKNEAWNGYQNSDAGPNNGIYSAYGDDCDTGVFKNGQAYCVDRDNDNSQYASPNYAQISLSSLLTDDDEYTFFIDSYEKQLITDVAYMQRLIVGTDDSHSFLNWMSDQLMSVLGDTTGNALALEYARSVIMDMIWPDDSIQNYAMNHDTRDKDEKDNKTYEYNAIRDLCAHYTTNTGWWAKGRFKQDSYDHLGIVANQNTGIAVNLNNLAQVFMTAFIEYSQGLENSSYEYGVDIEKKNAKLFDPTLDSNVRFERTIGASYDDGGDVTISTFYDALFNLICTQGWVENDNINDAEYLQEMLRTGLVYISNLNMDDGLYHQENYNVDKFISEVADEDAIAKAEALYHTEKARIESKENTLDLKMKNLDTEITALNEEYQSTKQIISKSIDKSFKRYDG